MVTTSRSSSKLMIVLKPNHSSTWRNNQLVLLALAVPSLGIAAVFAFFGAWPILPFAGLEITALGVSLYYVNWKLEYRHVITLSDKALRIDKGFYAPRKTWQFDRAESSLAITPENHPWEGPSIALHDNREQVRVGEFLNRDDCLELLALLRPELRVGTYSTTSQTHI